MGKPPRTHEQIDAALADVVAKIDALLSHQNGRVLDLVDQGYSVADAVKAATSEARARPPLDLDELDRLTKLRDKLWRERQKLKDTVVGLGRTLLPKGDWE
jgi:ABC-type transporter Mla subunit MlaD